MGVSTTCSCVPNSLPQQQFAPAGGYADPFAYGYPQQYPTTPGYPGAYAPGYPSAQSGSMEQLLQAVTQLTQLVGALTSILQARSGASQFPPSYPQGTLPPTAGTPTQNYPSVFDETPPTLPPVAAPRPQQGPPPSQGPTPSPIPTQGPAPAPGPASTRGQQAVDTAKAQLGKMYEWGGNGPNTFDCSGLVKFALKSVGADTQGRTTQDMWNEGTPVDKSQLQPGDVVYFGGPPPTHTAMYIGDGQVIHASTTGQPVKITALENAGAYVGARRYT